jgi:multidrug resistance efflux pump
MVQRAAVSPFKGFVATAPVRAGEIVEQGQLLATMDDRDLRLERAKWASELEQAEQKQRDAMAKKERAAALVLAAQARQAAAQLALVDEKLARSRIAAPVAGLVVTGDLSQLLGSPLEQGQVLFEIAPLDDYRVIVQVDERDIAWVQPGQRGTLVLTGKAGDPIGFSVSRVSSVSEAREGSNTFRVEAALDKPLAELRPGMEGVAKISAGEQRVVWVWTRRFVDWLRVTLWRWLP